MADEIAGTMHAAGYVIQEADPFTERSMVSFGARETSPYVGRLRLMWAAMREPVLGIFPNPPGLPKNIGPYLARVDDTYRSDAYHSLSIEGYQVSAALIERVRSGDWNPDNNEQDRQNRNALAARGYWQAFQSVKRSVEEVLRGANAGAVADHDHATWYRQLFGPSVGTGILKAADLAGYRNGPVHIRRSMHVPPGCEALREILPEFFDLLQQEQEPAVRVVLGHFFFVWAHPYFDGNGRIGRFLMNLMMASGGWPWTVIPVESRDTYMAALEDASVRQNIMPFARFIAERLADPTAATPR
jgi:Fic family protein